MKKSEELREQAAKADNDLAAMGLYNKALREERVEKFGAWYDKLLRSDKVISISEQGGKFTINTDKYGIIDYFPKANKLLIRKENEWKEKGLNWIINNLL